MLAPLRLAYFALLGYCLVFFAVWTVALVRGRRPNYSVPRGSSLIGILWAFSRGMLPWRKESARLYPLSYTAGIIYHVGTFCALLLLAFPRLFDARLSFIPIVLFAGCASGFYLLVKRVLTVRHRLMSQFDDYFSNLIVDSLQFNAALAAAGAVPLVLPYASAYVVLLYLPYGKLKHCYFFFASRILLGASYGRRGVYI
jgi:hypothetical protein